ncbi:SPOR domain-containing protein [Modicisalibacter xianhensis]|uniref:Cell division protein FtsN n=1 Tax=Modicisalibacter xianhensis TaxID=442341 RepID=A0A1I3E6X9_9GAMM|nr:SPOR domain-containing protein [Halomonas xianhensis]SFH94747.1 Cell division protein FtsN [Halomonas xianhensis]
MARRSASQGSARRAPPKGATARRAPRQKERRSVPGWLWGLAGLMAGFALSQYLQETAPPLATVVPKPPSAQQAAESSGGKPQQASAPQEPRMPTFEFYTLLPESEVIAPKVEDVQSTPATTAVADVVEASAPASTATKKPAAPAPSESQASYMLQAASFKEAADAKRLAGRLQDFGLLAKITEVKAQGNQTWHRVQVGPYQDTRELNRAQDLMMTQGIEPLRIKLQN